MTVRLSKAELEKADDVLSLRRGGASVEQITAGLGLRSDAVTRALFERALAAADTSFSALLEVDRMDRLHRAWWPAATRGDKDATDRVLRISERREALMGRIAALEGAHELEDAFDRTAAASKFVVTGLDDAVVQSGRKLARQIDAVTATGDQTAVTKALYLTPHLVGILDKLLATPASREAAGKQVTEAANSRLAQLRSVPGAGPGKRTG